MDFDSNALRVFCQAFEARSFSIAARKLKPITLKSQPTPDSAMSRNALNGAKSRSSPNLPHC